MRPVPAEFVVGDLDGDRIVVSVLRREFPDSSDYWDVNWLQARLDVRIRYFRARFEAYLLTVDLSIFRQRLDLLLATTSIVAQLESIEETLNLDVRMDDGVAEIRGSVTGTPGGWCTLSFLLYVDDLRPMTDQLRDVERQFPVIGTPS